MAAKTVLDRARLDICQVEYTETGLFWKAPRGTPGVLTFIDVMAKPAHRRYLAAQGSARPGAWAKWQITRAVEAYAASKFQCVFTLSEEDRRWANRLYPRAKARVLKYPGGIEFRGIPRRESARTLLFVGALQRPPNLEAIQWFLDGCWPAIRREIPDAELRIVGQGLPESHRLRWSADPGITIVGPVDSVEEHYRTAAIFIAPMLTGGGIIVKILDALAAGVPVVTTTRGNEGIGAEDGKSILIADQPESFASSVVRLLRNGELRERIGDSAKQYAEHAFSAAAFASTLDETYAELMRVR
jgi:glycosyltransferase involved in cell wall biosynthesis